MTIPDFADRKACDTLVAAISVEMARINRPVSLMEVCGTHTMNFFRYGLKPLFPKNLSILSGPGCPVCVTPDNEIDAIIATARLDHVTCATFGDMIRVPGTVSSLEQEKTSGADIRIVYSPIEVLRIALAEPSRTVVFPAIGFETTTPLTAWIAREAKRRNVKNLRIFVFHKTILPAMELLLESGETRVDGFLCPGNVSAITGWKMYLPLAAKHRKACVVTGFEPVDLLLGLLLLLRQISQNRASVENEYSRAVTANGNTRCQAEITRVFSRTDATWRGLGTIPGSGLAFKPCYSFLDAKPLIAKSRLPKQPAKTSCKCGDILRGVLTPEKCPLFGAQCTPESPKGPCMVSSEGTCAAHYRYKGAT